MTGNPDWGLILTIIAVCALITEIYYRVYRPRTKDKEQKRNEIYKPLIKDVDALIEKVTKKEAFSPPFNWKTVKDKVSTHLYEKLQRLFEEKYNRYYELLQHNLNFIRFKSYYYLNSNIPELQEEFRKLGVGKLEYDLYESIVTPILEGEKITLRWLEDNNSELYKNLKKCSSYEKLKRLLDWLNKEDPCIVFLRKAEQDMLQLAEKMKDELKKY